MIIDQIKKDNMQAMRDHDSVARAIYGVIMNKALLFNIECKKNGKEMTDNDMVQILQKTIKELTEEQANYAKVNNSAEVENLAHQIEIAKKYLPKMLSEDEVKEIIAGLTDKSIPAVMKYFKAKYAGKVDMGLVNKIARG